MSKQHYFLVTGLVTVAVQFEEGAPTEIAEPMLNTVVHNEFREFGLQLLAQSTTGLQMAYREKTGDTTGEILNVVISSVFYMGHMTREQYKRRPKPGDESLSLAQAIANSVTVGDA